MPRTMGAYAPQSLRRIRTSCVRHVQAELISIGGLILLFLCIVFSVIAFMSLSAGATEIQSALVGVLALGAWMYFLDSVTERLVLVNDQVCFKALLSRTRCIPLLELEAMLLQQNGFSLEQGMQSIEFRRRGYRPDRLILGPCWRRHQLEEFLHSVGLALNDPSLAERAHHLGT